MGGKVLDYEAKTIYMDGKNDGIALGMALGMAQGVAQGMAQGMEQGVAQGRASMVLDMIKDGLEIGTIARIARMIAKTTPIIFNTTILPGSLFQPIFLDPCPSDRSGDPLCLEVMCPLIVRFEMRDWSSHILHLKFPAIHL